MKLASTGGKGRRGPDPGSFDVLDFLRTTDTDMRSALSSLLLPPVLGKEEVVSSPGIEKTEEKANTNPEVKITPPVKLGPPSHLEGGPNLRLAPVARVSRENLGEGDSGQRQFRVRYAQTAADGHSRAEQQVWEALWENAEPGEDPGERSITIGFLALGRLAGLSESNARLNLRSLLRKLAVEEIATFVCQESKGRTYRIFSEERTLANRRARGWNYYTKRTLAVVFVDPETGERLNLEGNGEGN